MKVLSIIIPVFNEERTIDEVIKAVLDVSLPQWKKDIIIIDDGSTDSTRERLKFWEKKVRVLYKQKNEGKGSALNIGFQQAKGDVLIIQDADLEYSPKDYAQLLAPFDNVHVNVVYGSRFLGSHLSTMFVYELGNKFVTFMTNVLYNTNITDMETGYKAFRSSVIKEITIQSKRFDVEPEITAKILKKGYQIFEVPISYFGRKFSDGKKLTWRDGIVALWVLFKHRIFS
jgi:glycosyltransferase involved in cell wall biosynthesis